MPRDVPILVVDLRQSLGAMAFVQQSALGRALDHDALVRLTRDAVVADYAEGARVFETGDVDEDLMIVIEGAVSLGFLGPSGWSEQARAERNQLFGEVETLQGGPRRCCALVSSAVRLVRVPGEAVRTAAQEQPKLGRRLAALMAARPEALR